LKSSLGLGGAYFLNALPFNFKFQEGGPPAASLSVGETAPAAAFVSDKNLNRHTILELCARQPQARVNLLYIYGGRVPKSEDRLGGIWCVDSFSDTDPLRGEDLHIPRFLHLKYQPQQLRIIPIACPPVYSSQNYGFEARVFLDQPEDSKKFQESAAAFIELTEKLFVEGYLPVPSFYGLRLLFNRREDLRPGEGYGAVYGWQGAFRGSGESQRYGTPTIWLLDSRGKVLAEPFFGNLYHSDPYEIRYTIVEVDRAIQQNLPQ
jgi:hypothetical protein